MSLLWLFKMAAHPIKIMQRQCLSSAVSTPLGLVSKSSERLFCAKPWKKNCKFSEQQRFVFYFEPHDKEPCTTQKL
ncbi:hypothetical protein CEXT_400281 [Caerostris extrusa]|uniref:Uncharacterized protein n=1 Tax=Caerostris extrusa TaxID=172846 RepID=A0AAV4Q9G3_CAEEX|nr:hypothetical protein CEXT_400281 [Caerostris extrusa]